MEGECALEVGLFEDGEDSAGVRGFEVGVQVDLPVFGVGEAVQALPGAGECAAGDHRQVVFLLQSVEEDARAVEDDFGVEAAAVEDDRVDSRGEQVGEGGCAGLGAAEANPGDRAESVPIRMDRVAQVQGHVVGVGGEQSGPFAGLAARQGLAGQLFLLVGCRWWWAARRGRVSGPEGMGRVGHSAADRAARSLRT
ncbi:hypothetical protein GCM10025734_00760 [Kitasatospora paranensis]